MSGSKGILNVIVPYSASSGTPVNLLFDFPKEHSNIEIKLREVSDEYPIEKLFEDEEVDVGLVIVNEKFNICDYELMLKREVVIVVLKDRNLAKKDEISITKLENEPLVLKLVEAGEEDRFVSKCLEYGFTPHVNMK